MFDFGYDPSERRIRAGDTVVWTHEGDVSHTVTFSGGGPDSGTLRAGDGYELTFDEPGTYRYFCRFHGQMQGTITVEG